jgi:tRNA(Ile)-lysidine synthase
MSPLENLVFDNVSICVMRPFLNEDPVALADLVATYGLPIVEDPTNELVDRARNLVRHQVLPVLCDINSGAVINIARSTQILRDENKLLSSIVESRMSHFASLDVLDGAELSREPMAIQRRIIRLWVREATGLELTFDRTEAVREVAVAGTGNVVLEIGEGWTARQDKRQITLRRNG